MAVVITAEVMVAATAAMGMVAMAAECLQAAFRLHPLLRRRSWRARRVALPMRRARGFVNNAVGR
ncbi:hypothetical protein SAMN03159371_07513 [Variovorax sp. NFACC28]|jgi:hypothetical protein|nr:hypothetical protein SAMN03159371_06607 [Variovorax sp. NFACC28]SEG98990.1 hypothetical protein SAMN03159365_07423 [Variovorax sp. NFACC29]SFE16606.1 hypothetical protein SAMN03159379_07438 [Variovorax sp. NFACC26]SFH06782.1 hypothetical protein SAMN03159447_06429 [Variovorax sp. NFACC27]SEF35236.1 hypothetical protein SAMN03159371_07513 [Variovorax sp. NFACC28]